MAHDPGADADADADASTSPSLLSPTAKRQTIGNPRQYQCQVAKRREQTSWPEPGRVTRLSRPLAHPPIDLYRIVLA
ncbi:hypothetical protein CTA1_6610 [Colletotrichum tanaceti]|uniref:Uncharacterized protein n=1 Tax=Colletotrichum tanaceti TaxID=1306861 RepID=A0A4V6DGW0_9PEZI|nr:hypothetical protein CTA1_6610 [Colletotrichum tanaceti]